MKKLLIGLLALGSISSFAAECKIMVKGDGNSVVSTLLSRNLPKSEITEKQVRADFGVHFQLYKSKNSDLKDPFGNPVIEEYRNIYLFEDGKRIYSIGTQVGNPNEKSIEDLVTLVSGKLKDNRCD